MMNMQQVGDMLNRVDRSETGVRSAPGPSNMNMNVDVDISQELMETQVGVLVPPFFSLKVLVG